MTRGPRGRAGVGQSPPRRGALRQAALAALVALAGAACGGSGTSPQGPRCGPSRCDPGEECCNASCGTCVPPGGPCALVACGASPCRRDSDCRTFSFQCGTCECWALGVDDPTPACPTVPCLVDPCRGRTAGCDPATSRCVVR